MLLLSPPLLFLLTPLVLGKASIIDLIAQLESEQHSPLLQYPTQLTQNIVPKPIHSHNDYWRDVPLLSALSVGAASVEADVWFINGSLFVGHELGALTPDRTFDALYVQPLLRILDAQNPQTEFTAGVSSVNGPFDTAGEIPLQLLVDIKTDGVEALPPILDALEPLRKRGYLTTFTNGTLKRSGVIVVGTGNSPLEQIKALDPRDYFFDAPLAQLDASWEATLSPLASTDYAAAVGWNGLGDISEAQRNAIASLVNEAQQLGIRARFWNTPEWPIFARENIWRELLNAGVGWLNADDLLAASQF